MDAIVAALAEQHAELEALLARLDDDAWQRPTPCEGWTVADVVLHLAQTDELAHASARGHMGDALQTLAGGLDAATSVDDGAAALVERERGASAPFVLARWRAAASELRDVFASTDPHARLVWVAGELSARTLATTRLAETWIHTHDVAAALDRKIAPTDRLWHVARLAWRTLPYAFGRSGRELTGPVAFELRGPHGDDWTFVPDSPALTRIAGDAFELCLVAGRRLAPADSRLHATGPDAAATLELVRTYA